ncbi:MAG TPA: NACHT domain-containing protein [Abditibacterium sp.]
MNPIDPPVENAAEIWRLECFGAARVTRGERVVERFRTQKTMALLALLALRGAQSREALCALLWPDGEPEAARNSLSAALSSLRRELGEEVLVADRQNVSLAPGAVETDAAAFDFALKNRDFARAVELYRGPFLPRFYEDPFPALAGEYEEKARGAFMQRLEELETGRDADALCSLARRAFVLFGDDERWFLSLMRAHHSAGDVDAALRAYDSLLRHARKSGDVASETARALAKVLRREKEMAGKVVPATAKIEEIAANREKMAPALNLPAQWTCFFGREAEKILLRDWLCGGERLVTLTGAGGSGKTRLAVETLREIAADWEPQNRVFWVPLASLSDARLLFSAIRDVLQIPAAPDLPPLEQLVQALRGGRCLLLLDNFEQLVEGGAAQLQALRERLPDASFLVTSRLVLRLPGEREFPLSPLPTPLQATAPREVSACASAALFCDRAGLHVDEANAQSIGALCRRLDGIPLALELAAARAKVLSPTQILERLETHPDLLQSRERGVPPRHKTLRAAIEWSLDLLPDAEREFFAHLAVFRGGWTLEAAEQVAAPRVCEEWEALDILETLRAHSLLLVEDTPSGTRYRLLETLREWGASALSSAAQTELRRRHAQFYLALAESAPDALQLAARVDEFSCEMPNFRAALKWALDEEEVTLAAALAGALSGFWELRAHFSEGCEWSWRAWEAVRGRAIEPEIRARLACGAGVMFWHQSDMKRARVLLETGLELQREVGNRCGEAQALEFLARVALINGDGEESRRCGEAAVEVARDCGDGARLIGALLAAGWGCHNSGDLDGALRYLGECRAIGEAIGEKRLAVLCDATRALVLQNLGRETESAALCERVPGEVDESLGVWVMSFARAIIGQTALRLGNIEQARAILPQVTREFHAVSTRWEVANLLMSCGDLAVLVDDSQRAALLYGASDALRTRSGCTVVPVLRPFYEECLARLDESLDATTRDELWRRGANLSVDEAVALTQDLA